MNGQPQNSVDPVLTDSITSFIHQGKHEEAWGLTLDLDEIFRLYFQIQIRLDQLNLIESQKLLQKALTLTHNHPDPAIKNIWIKLKLYLIVVLLNVDRIKGIESYNEFLALPQVTNEFTMGMTNLIDGMIHFDATKLQKSIDYLIASEELCMLLEAYTILCHIHGGKKGIELVDKAIAIFQQFGHVNYANSFGCLKGYFYQTLGDYKSARLFNTKAEEECKKTNFVFGIADANICLGSIANEEGRITEAIERLEPSSKIFYQTVGFYPGLPILIQAYRHSGMYEKGLEQSLAMLDRTTLLNQAIFDRFFMEITLLVLTMNRLEQAKELYERFKSLAGSTPNSNIENSLKLCQALILMKSKSMASASRAQTILRELLQSPTLPYYLRIETIKHLCELLLLEYELYEQEEILLEVQQLIDTLSNIAQDQNLIRLTFESGIISSKLELLKNEFGKARKILVDLHEYASTTNLTVYERVVSREIAILDENYKKWLDLVEGNASMRELMEKTNIKNYMTNALQQIADLK